MYIIFSSCGIHEFEYYTDKDLAQEIVDKLNIRMKNSNIKFWIKELKKAEINKQNLKE